ncbi:VOC family protein [Methanolobus sp.]|jgi:PhnB protein|uniref:VOC family protein n=1 Tax=Methanolobus sp. TaxID=1874737 RepID=UPI0025F99546|nr:VOC family protein [Methanolobus sp.]
MTIRTYINFNGNCREAVEFYADVFETEKPEFMLYRDMPDDDDSFSVTEDNADFILHTSLDIEGSTVMFSDIPPGMPFTVGNNVSLVIIGNDMEKIKKMYNRIRKDGGTVGMELEETFWAKLYGYVTDKFGVGWQFNYDEEVE